MHAHLLLFGLLSLLQPLQSSTGGQDTDHDERDALRLCAARESKLPHERGFLQP